MSNETTATEDAAKVERALHNQICVCRILAARLIEWSGSMLATRWALDRAGLSADAAKWLEDTAAEMQRRSASASVEAAMLEHPTEYALASMAETVVAVAEAAKETKP